MDYQPYVPNEAPLAPSISVEQARSRFSRIGFFSSAFLVLGNILLPIVAMLVLIFAFHVSPFALMGGVMLYLLTYGCMYGVALPISFLLLKDVPPMPLYEENNVKYTPIQVLSISVFVLGVNYLASYATTIVQELLPFLQDSYEASIGAMFGTNIWLAFFLIVVLAPIMEEVLFRHIILSRLRGFGDRFAVLACGLFFGLFHCMVTQFFFATVLGCVLSYVTLRTGNIKFAVFLHFLNNFISFSLSVLSTSLPESAVTVLMYIWSGFSIGLMVIAVAFIIMYRKKVFFAESRVEIPYMKPSNLFYSSFGVLTYFLVSFALTFFVEEITMFLMSFIF